MGSTVKKTDAWRGARIANLPARALCAVVAASVCLALAPAAVAVGATSFTWKGEGATSAKQWGLGANWVGGVAPAEEEKVQLVFPELTAPACTPIETKACYHSENSELTLATEKLTIDDGDNYVLTGREELELGKGGLTASPEGHTSGARDEIAVPVELTEPQTWHIAGAGAGDDGVLLEEEVSEAGGAAGGLHIVQSDESALVLGPKADVELGPVTIEGEDAGKAGFENGSVELQGNEINWLNEETVTLKHVAFAGFGGIGELETEGAEVRVQTGGGRHPYGLEAESVELDASSKVAFEITGSGEAPGKDYSQLYSEGETELGGATLEIDVASPGLGKPCPTLKAGQEYTFVEAELFGSVSGEFGNAPEGAKIPIHFGAGCDAVSQKMTIHYHEGAVTGTMGPPEFPLTVYVTGSGKVSSTPSGINNCGPQGGAACEAEFEEGTVTLTATPEPEYVFAGWIGCKKASEHECKVAVNAASEVTAVFLEKGKEGSTGKEGKEGPTGKEGKEGKEGSTGKEGPTGKEGSAGQSGAQGPAGLGGPVGAAGPGGPAGPAGPAGKEGPPGKVQIVTCTTKGKKKKCTTKTVSGVVKFTASAERATLSRHGLVYARGAATRGAHGSLRLRVTALRALHVGRYTLTLTSGSGRHEHTRTEAFMLS